MCENSTSAVNLGHELNQPGVEHEADGSGRAATSIPHRQSGGPLHQADDVEQHAFARTRRPLERDEFGLLQSQADAVQHLGFNFGTDVVAAADVG